MREAGQSGESFLALPAPSTLEYHIRTVGDLANKQHTYPLFVLTTRHSRTTRFYHAAFPVPFSLSAIDKTRLESLTPMFCSASSYSSITDHPHTRGENPTGARPVSPNVCDMFKHLLTWLVSFFQFPPHREMFCDMDIDTVHRGLILAFQFPPHREMFCDSRTDQRTITR